MHLWFNTRVCFSHRFLEVFVSSACIKCIFLFFLHVLCTRCASHLLYISLSQPTTAKIVEQNGTNKQPTIGTVSFVCESVLCLMTVFSACWYIQSSGSFFSSVLLCLFEIWFSPRWLLGPSSLPAVSVVPLKLWCVFLLILFFLCDVLFAQAKQRWTTRRPGTANLNFAQMLGDPWFYGFCRCLAVHFTSGRSLLPLSHFLWGPYLMPIRARPYTGPGRRGDQGQANCEP